LKITAEITHQSVNFLDVTFNLRDESYQPYRKPKNDPLFIDSRSNHPPAITKQLPTSVNMRISQLSSNQEAFSKTAPLYEAALRRSNYQADLKYSPNNSNKTRTRSRNIIWFNPPYRVYQKKLNRFEIALNFAKHLFVSGFYIYSFFGYLQCRIMKKIS
jgi:hypothetical protein